MVDYAKVQIIAGSGGNGSGAFFQTKGKRHGKANGGSGGGGGSVYAEATTDLNTLEPYRFVKKYQAQNGKPGLSNQSRGANGDDLTLKVPIGTQIVIAETSTTFDLTTHGEKVLLARGGEGGRGNVHLRDEYGRRPRAGELGKPGEEFNLTLELKIIAQVGLIGLPNAGKSTLLAAITRAHPQIASYPFTTLEPNLGVLHDSKIVIADVPGLIEGAAQGRGLGINFLRHVERTTLLLHLVDVTSEDPWKDYQTIREELKAFNPALLKKKEIVVLSKIDMVEVVVVKEIQAVFSSHRKKTVAISASQKRGLEPLVGLLEKSA